MENQRSNPLAKYFRQPAIYINLPSRGKFWPESALELPATGDIPVYPLTARDEITLRTPDALMNGAGVVEVIQSCCPNIKNGWDMPSVDVDAVLVAIRIASYGHQMDVDTNCPHCKEENTHGFDLRISLEKIRCPDYSKKLEFDGLKIKLKPVPYFGSNKQNIIDFEQQRLMKALEGPDVDPELRAREINDSMSKLVDIALDTVVSSTEYIETEDGTIVTDTGYITDFYKNAKGSVIKTVQKRLGELNVEGGIPAQTAPCTHCEKEYPIALTFDYASFFANGS
jgi:T4 bacteriophage base plate protein